MKLLGLLLPLIAASCTTLPNPYEADTSRTDPTAASIIEKSAAAHGDPWKRYSRVNVSFTGEWSDLATRIQPALTDPAFRESSIETYRPASKRVSQTHTGPKGTKTVSRYPASISVSYNGAATDDPEKLDAAALVADAYTVFVFGSSWLAENATGFQLLPGRSIEGEPCHLVSGIIKPGFGRSEEDRFIAWISEDTGYLKRFQFTLNGLESTKGADVDVVFSEMRKTSDGSVWPTHFIERVQRPVNIKAHEWRTTSLSLDGRKVW
jgi:hypothetical protein